MDAYDLLYLIAFYHKLSRFGTWHYSNGLIIMENIKQYNFVFYKPQNNYLSIYSEQSSNNSDGISGI